MSYVRAQDIFPQELLEQIQEYVHGEYVYIPRKVTCKMQWGEQSRSKEETRRRNEAIYRDFLSGLGVTALAEGYYLSEKSIRRILLEQKRLHGDHE